MTKIEKFIYFLSWFAILFMVVVFIYLGTILYLKYSVPQQPAQKQDSSLQHN